MLRIEEIVGAMDDDFRDALEALDDARLAELAGNRKALNKFRPVGVSQTEALAMIAAIQELRRNPPPPPPPPSPPPSPEPEPVPMPEPDPIPEPEPVPEPRVEADPAPMPEPLADADPEPAPPPAAPAATQPPTASPVAVDGRRSGLLPLAVAALAAAAALLSRIL